MSFSFGTPTSAPATSGLTSGFSFGAAKPATPGFGLGSTPTASGGLFGSPASSAPAFGSTTTPAFGATSTPGFGATTTPAFGATSTPAFGAAAPSFGTTPGFGASTASSFGATSTPSFGATTTPAFGTTTTQSFGAGLGTGGLNFGATSTGQTGLSFGAPASKGLTATFPQTNTLFGGAGTSKLGTTTLGGTQPASSAAPSLGLGGSSTSAGLGVTNTTQSGDGKSEPPKQMKLPNEISTMVDTFKEFVKKQKSLSSDVMRVSIKPLNNVSRQVDSLLHGAASLASSVSRARAHSRRLRSAGADALAAADAAQRQAQGLAYSEEGAALPRFVKELIAELEQQLISLRRQMDEADKQMQTAPKLLSEQELTLGIRRMHESLVALAGRLQGVHSQVEAQKEQYLNLRRYVLKDPTNVFDTQSNSTSLEQILRDAESGQKKTGFADSLNSAVLSDPRTALGNIQQLAGPTPFSYIGSTVPTYNPAETSGSAWQPQPSLSSSFPAPSFGFGAETSGFQLQKPPGKRTKQ